MPIASHNESFNEWKCVQYNRASYNLPLYDWVCVIYFLFLFIFLLLIRRRYSKLNLCAESFSDVEIGATNRFEFEKKKNKKIQIKFH